MIVSMGGGEEDIKDGDEVIPCMIIFKANNNQSRLFLDKLKA